MATELISAKDLPATEAEEVDVLCVDNGELKRKQAKGLGGAGVYILKVPLSDVVQNEDGSMTIILSESYDNFMPILYEGGTLIGDISEIIDAVSGTAGAVSYAQTLGWSLSANDGFVATAVLGMEMVPVFAPNGTWTPPTE